MNNPIRWIISPKAARLAFGLIIVTLVLAVPAMAGGKTTVQRYFSSMATQVKAAATPEEKRAVMNESLQNMSQAIDMVRGFAAMSREDDAAMGTFQASIKEKQDELAGTNGFAQVSNSHLNAFSMYVVQDMEQADQVITISVVTLLLLAILLILLVK